MQRYVECIALCAHFGTLRGIDLFGAAGTRSVSRPRSARLRYPGCYSTVMGLPPPANAAPPPIGRLIFCVGGIICSFGFYGFLLESLTLGGRRISELALLTINCALCAVIARVAMATQGETPKRVPKKYFVAIAVSYLASMFLSWRALRFVNYPTQILAKSAKAIPIMAMNFVFGKRYTVSQYASVMLIVGGTCVFMLYKPGKGGGAGATTAVGAVLLVLSLLCDGTTGALEDKVLAVLGWKHGEGTFDLMYNINLYAAPLAFTGLVASGGVGSLFGMSMAEATSATLLGLAVGIGQLFIFYTIANFGALVCSIITTSRKVLQIVFSVIWFGHPIAAAQLGGLGLAISGLVLNVYAKKK